MLTIGAGGIPGWQIALTEAGAALFAAIVAVLLDRARMARKLPTTTAGNLHPHAAAASRHCPPF